MPGVSDESGSPIVRVGVLGCGNVGAPLVDLIATQCDTVQARTGLRLEVTRVAVRDLAKPRAISLPTERLTTDAAGIVDDPDIDLVVELIGGIEPARELILAALKAGKPVVTGNKELLAHHGAELFQAAEASGVDLLFEAAVAGGIPIIRPLRESLVGERITRVMGLVNGTTNYILTRMTESGASYADALAEAQSLGYAEADPTADVEGYDAGAKVAILGDLIDAALNRSKGSHASVGQLGQATIRPIDEVESAYYLNVEVLDRPGVLAQVAGVFGEHRVSIRSMEQEGLGDEARLIFITHRAREADVRSTLRDLAALDAVDRIGSVLRVVGDEA